MPAFVQINMRVIDEERQALIGPRFIEALHRAGGRVVYFGHVVEQLEGDVPPYELAGVFEFADVEAALAFYGSAEYAPIKAERALAQKARMFVVRTTA